MVTHMADEHANAISALAESGLVPPLRLVPRVPDLGATNVTRRTGT